MVKLLHGDCLDLLDEIEDVRDVYHNVENI